MGSSLAIAATTAAICQLLREALAEDFPGAKVTHVDADGAAGGDAAAHVNVALAALASPALRNRDGRSLVFELTYRISCGGDSATLEAQRLLGSVAAALHGTPLLGPELFERAARATPSLAGFATAEMAPVELIQAQDTAGRSLGYVARNVVLAGAGPASTAARAGIVDARR